MSRLISIWPYSMSCGPAHVKTNKLTCVPREDLDQPGHLPSLILGYLATYWVHSEDSDWSTGWMTDLSLQLAHGSFCLFCHAAAQFYIYDVMLWVWYDFVIQKGQCFTLNVTRSWFCYLGIHQDNGITAEDSRGPAIWVPSIPYPLNVFEMYPCLDK